MNKRIHGSYTRGANGSLLGQGKCSEKAAEIHILP